MEIQEYQALVKEYESKQRELKELRTYSERFDAFKGFFFQALCLRVQPSREKQKGKHKRTYLVVKVAFRSVLLVKVPLFGYQIEEGDTLYWIEPKDFSDEVVLLGIKKRSGVLEVFRKTFKNAEGKSCPTMFFIEPQYDILKVRVRIVGLESLLKSQREIYQSSMDVPKLNSATKKGGSVKNKPLSKRL